MREVEVFGRRLLVERTSTGWQTCSPGDALDPLTAQIASTRAARRKSFIGY